MAAAPVADRNLPRVAREPAEILRALGRRAGRLRDRPVHGQRFVHKARRVAVAAGDALLGHGEHVHVVGDPAVALFAAEAAGLWEGNLINLD